MLLENKTALITGASRGIGEAITRAFAKHGANVVLTSRSRQLEAVGESLTIPATKRLVILGDITNESHQLAIFQAIRKQFGHLDVLVNNAGVLRPGLVGMTPIQDIRQMFETNVFASLSLTQLAVRMMNKSESPSIINLASIAGTSGIDGMSAYSASKAAIVGFTRAAAKELAPKRIRVNAIAPGFIDTDMARIGGEEFVQRRTQSVRMGRIGSPIDVANCALFLASELSAYVTGQVIGVDGGLQV